MNLIFSILTILHILFSFQYQIPRCTCSESHFYYLYLKPSQIEEACLKPSQIEEVYLKPSQIEEAHLKPSQTEEAYLQPTTFCADS